MPQLSMNKALDLINKFPYRNARRSLTKLIKEQKCVPKLTDFIMQIFNEFTLLPDKAYLQAFAQLTLTVVGLPA